MRNVKLSAMQNKNLIGLFFYTALMNADFYLN